MTILHEIFRGASGNVVHWLPFLVTLLLSALALAVARWLVLVRKVGGFAQSALVRQLTMLALTAVAVIVLILTLPVGDTSRAQLLSLIGLVLTGVLALSSTTFVGNAMAGLMLRAVRAYRPGDFLRTGEHFGRVSERGLLHTEIQTEDRDLTTLPNLYLVTNPVTVMRSSGTVVSATVSLGYDVHRARIEEALLEAARVAELEEPFVQILELGDFSVQYRVAGFLREVKYLLSARSRLRAGMLDALHTAEIEIVSPTFMNQRRVPEDRRFIPPRPRGAEAPGAEEERPVPEEIIFDKAELAESREQLKEQLTRIEEALKGLHRRGGATEGPAAQAEARREIERLEARRDAVIAAIRQFDGKEPAPQPASPGSVPC